MENKLKRCREEAKGKKQARLVENDWTSAVYQKPLRRLRISVRPIERDVRKKVTNDSKAQLSQSLLLALRVGVWIALTY